MRDYASLVRALNDVDEAETRATTAVTGEFAAGVRGVEAEVARAEQAVRETEAAVRAAKRAVNAVDERSRRLWTELSTLLGWRGRGLGDVPRPAPDLTSRASAREHLDWAAATIGRSALGRRMAPIPRSNVALLPFGGAIAAMLAVLLIRGVTALAGAPAVTMIAPILVFFAPFSGVPPLLVWARHRYGAGPDVGAMALTALGGTLASCAMLWALS